MCAFGTSLWHSDELRGLSGSKGGQQEPAFPQQGSSRRERMEVRQQAQGDGEGEVSTAAWTLAASGWAVGAKLCTEGALGGAR